MRQVILYRGYDFEKDELKAAKEAGFVCTNSRMDIQQGDLVIARYSCLPFYEEQERDLKKVGATLINTHAQHRYIADLMSWYEDLREFTPTTWLSTMDLPPWEDGPFVLKGETNSKKNLFNTHMFAKNRASIGHVMGRLLEDSLIKQQRIYIRKHEPFVTYMHAINDLPVTREFRFFVAYGQILSGAYYWSSHIEELVESGIVGADDIDPNAVPREGFLDEIVRRLKFRANAIVIDVAQHEDGRWRLVELNDLQMAGLSENKPEVLYPNLMKALKSAV